VSRFTRFYGAGPLHLLGMLAAIALAGYAAFRVSLDDQYLRVAVWFLGAVVLHDLLLYPLYALADRSLAALTSRTGRGPRVAADPGVAVVNHVRVPALMSGLLLLLFWPAITRHSEGTLSFASGLTSAPFLGRWLLITAALWTGSALLYAVRLGRARGHRA
jgi:hypothetical protein